MKTALPLILLFLTGCFQPSARLQSLTNRAWSDESRIQSNNWNTARSGVAAVNAAERAPLTEDTALSGTVRIGVSYTVAGYFLGTVEFVAKHIDVVTVGIIALSIVPMVVEALRQKRSRG